LFSQKQKEQNNVGGTPTLLFFVVFLSLKTAFERSESRGRKSRLNEVNHATVKKRIKKFL